MESVESVCTCTFRDFKVKNILFLFKITNFNTNPSDFTIESKLHLVYYSVRFLASTTTHELISCFIKVVYEYSKKIK